MDDFTKRRAFERYVHEVFFKAEEHSVLMLACSAWALKCLQSLRASAYGGNDLIEDFPDEQMRTFEELGRELDALLRRVNTDFPKTNPKQDEE